MWIKYSPLEGCGILKRKVEKPSTVKRTATRSRSEHLNVSRNKHDDDEEAEKKQMLPLPNHSPSHYAPISANHSIFGLRQNVSSQISISLNSSTNINN